MIAFSHRIEIIVSVQNKEVWHIILAKILNICDWHTSAGIYYMYMIIPDQLVGQLWVWPWSRGTVDRSPVWSETIWTRTEPVNQSSRNNPDRSGVYLQCHAVYTAATLKLYCLYTPLRSGKSHWLLQTVSRACSIKKSNWLSLNLYKTAQSPNLLQFPIKIQNVLNSDWFGIIERQKYLVEAELCLMFTL